VGVASREQHRTQLCHEQIFSYIIHGLPGHIKIEGEGEGEGEEEGAGEH
jgi:hypothetical protein